MRVGKGKGYNRTCADGKRLGFLGRVALGAQRPIAKLSRERSVVAYVRRSVGLSSALWKIGGSDPDAVWHCRSNGSRDEAGGGVWGSVYGKGYFWRRIWGAP